jgi:hypothetical protein
MREKALPIYQLAEAAWPRLCLEELVCLIRSTGSSGWKEGGPEGKREGQAVKASPTPKDGYM